MGAVILGSKGQLGRALCEVYPKARGLDLHASLPKDQINLARGVERLDRLEDVSIVFNAAGFTDVNAAQGGDGLSESEAVNATGVKLLSEWCEKHGVLLVHYSTDYVFRGSPNQQTEEDPTHPQLVFGMHKLYGERHALGVDSLVIRTQMLYNHGGNNLISRLVTRAEKSSGPLPVATDIVGSPTYALDLARKTQQMLHRNLRGLYHVTNTGTCSVYAFAAALFRMLDMDVTLEPVTFEEFAQREGRRYANRPLHNVLSNSKLASSPVREMRSWQDALTEYTAKKV